MVGVVASVVINWIIWPFVARHELRKAMSEMMFFMSVAYRSESSFVKLLDCLLAANSTKVLLADTFTTIKVTAQQRKTLSVLRSLKGRLREGFVRIRQLMVCLNSPTECC